MKKRIDMIIIGLLFISMMNGQDLEDYKWKNRILIIETPDKTNKDYQSQMKELANLEQELLDRKMLVTEIVKNKYKSTNYLLNQNDDVWKQLDKNKDEIVEFRVILIGLDGRIKLEKKEILSKEDLFAIIDSMPMRRGELGNKTNRKNNNEEE